MAKVYNTQKNINKLAWDVVDGLELDDLVQWAYEFHQTYYENMTREEFEEAWHNHFD